MKVFLNIKVSTRKMIFLLYSFDYFQGAIKKHCVVKLFWFKHVRVLKPQNF